VYEFPYLANSFDFVFLTSVFTHMMPAEFENYLAEIARVLKPGGRVFSTFFLHTAESARLLADGNSMIPFEPQGSYWVKNPQIPEDAICFRESYVVGQYARLGLQVDTPISYGVWCGRSSGLTSHDVVVATKTGAVSPAQAALHKSKRIIHHLSSRIGRSLRGARPGPVDMAVVRAREHLAKHPHLLRHA
jgi:SAM-dependent methyltransferase